MKLRMFALGALLTYVSAAAADPCGMVPPIYLGDGPPITRVGLQKTYVFYKSGVETFCIRPGFSGKVDEFGMLIPFPTPPAIRKIPDAMFEQLGNAIDPPEIVVNLNPVNYYRGMRDQMARSKSAREDNKGLEIERSVVKVIRQEAIGMYEVAVLDAGSPEALKKWMDEHKYTYPKGMDGACQDYIDLRWCFVAVKSKVGTKEGVDPQPGMRKVDNKMPASSAFDGAVQGMGFRFKSEKLVVPMRLSAFNEGKLRNVVYLLTDGPRRIRSIPEEYVVRQISGAELFGNVTDPLPLRVLGGTIADIPESRLESLKSQRDPKPHNGVARELFAGDLLAVANGRLSLDHEEAEKQLLNISEAFGLRGPEVDKLHLGELQAQLDKELVLKKDEIADMTMTVVDGDFPREVLSKQNLTFAEYHMPARRNKAELYDTKVNGPAAGSGNSFDMPQFGRKSFGWSRTLSLPFAAAFMLMASLATHRRRKD